MALIRTKRASTTATNGPGQQKTKYRKRSVSLLFYDSSSSSFCSWAYIGGGLRAARHTSWEVPLVQYSRDSGVEARTRRSEDIVQCLWSAYVHYFYAVVRKPHGTDHDIRSSVRFVLLSTADYAKLMRKRDKVGPDGKPAQIDLETLRASTRMADAGSSNGSTVNGNPSPSVPPPSSSTAPPEQPVPSPTTAGPSPIHLHPQQPQQSQSQLPPPPGPSGQTSKPSQMVLPSYHSMIIPPQGGGPGGAPMLPGPSSMTHPSPHQQHQQHQAQQAQMMPPPPHIPEGPLGSHLWGHGQMHGPGQHGQGQGQGHMQHGRTYSQDHSSFMRPAHQASHARASPH